MCGRYALALRPSDVRRVLAESNMPSQESVDDDQIRTTYNFAPGYYGLVYREDVPDRGAGYSRSMGHDVEETNGEGDDQENTESLDVTKNVEQSTFKEPKYKLQSMKWGLVPFWTKRNPDYGTLMRTINCRDDSLAAHGGMWQTMKLRKRCVVIAQGFFEWLKKNGGKEKIPHYVKRKDGQLMCFAGLWDCVKYEDTEDKLYSYSIVTTDCNKQLQFLHDRMPVILNSGSEELFRWLDSSRTEWTKELQSILKPFSGKLECYPVSKEVGKVGNDSPSFLIPLNSKENKQNIANFFGNQKSVATEMATIDAKNPPQELYSADATTTPSEVAKDADQKSSNAVESQETSSQNKKRELEMEEHPTTPKKSQKLEQSSQNTNIKSSPPSSASKRSGTKNVKVNKIPVKAGNGSKKITSFFNK